MQMDQTVSLWLSGVDSADGAENPAGPLFINGEAAMEAAMTGSNAVEAAASSGELTCCTVNICC